MTSLLDAGVFVAVRPAGAVGDGDTILTSDPDGLAVLAVALGTHVEIPRVEVTSRVGRRA